MFLADELGPGRARPVVGLLRAAAEEFEPVQIALVIDRDRRRSIERTREASKAPQPWPFSDRV